MAHHPRLRAKAIELRTERNLSIDEVAERLALSRTTVYYWLRGIPLGRRSRSNPHAGTRRMQAQFRAQREEAYAQGVAEFAALCAEPTFRDFVCMYIGEGCKRNRNRVLITNSDPTVVVLGDRWIKRYARNKMQYAVQYHADQDLDELIAFWSSLLAIAPEAIRLQRKSNSGGLTGRSWRSVHGVLTVCSSDTLLRARLQAWIDCVKAEWT